MTHINAREEAAIRHLLEGWDMDGAPEGMAEAHAASLVEHLQRRGIGYEMGMEELDADMLAILGWDSGADNRPMWDALLDEAAKRWLASNPEAMVAAIKDMQA